MAAAERVFIFVSDRTAAANGVVVVAAAADTTNREW
jgi:hypothetical protein